MAEVVSKRLIISGLTPAITPDALKNRFSSFGNVRNLDGFGALDGNGDMRRFAFVTLEAPKAKIQQCANALSGTSWKGTKLRLGEAHPSYRERIVRNRPVGTEKPPNGATMESAASTTKQPKTMKEKRTLRRAKKQKRRLLYKPREAVDMTLVTERNAKSKKGWRKTKDGRLIHPLRMRPAHPLPRASTNPTSTPALLTNSTTPESSADSHMKDARSPWKRTFAKSKATSKTGSDSSVPLDRARRTIIDPSRYGATHLRFSADVIPTDVAVSGGEQKSKKKVGHNALEIEGLRKRHIPAPVIATAPGPETKPSAVVPAMTEVDLKSSSSEPEPHQTTAETARLAEKGPASLAQQAGALSAQLQQEKSKTIALMRSVLKRGWEVDIDGNSDEESKEKEGERKKIMRMASVSDDEEGRREEPEREGDEQLDLVETQNPSSRTSARDEKAERIESSSSEPVGGIRAEKQDQSKKDRTEAATPSSRLTTAPSTEAAVKSKSLKDLFKPREEDASFSLLGNLASSGALSTFELEDVAIYEPAQHASVGTDSIQPPLSISVPTGVGGIMFDPKTPLFFGTPLFARQEDARKKSARIRDMFDVAKDQGWLEGEGFWRTATDEEMRRKWKAMRGVLTRTYKQRHREAVRLAKNVFGRDAAGADRGKD